MFQMSVCLTAYFEGEHVNIETDGSLLQQTVRIYGGHVNIESDRSVIRLAGFKTNGYTV